MRSPQAVRGLCQSLGKILSSPGLEQWGADKTGRSVGLRRVETDWKTPLCTNTAYQTNENIVNWFLYWPSKLWGSKQIIRENEITAKAGEAWNTAEPWWRIALKVAPVSPNGPAVWLGKKTGMKDVQCFEAAGLSPFLNTKRMCIFKRPLCPNKVVSKLPYSIINLWELV